MKESSGSQFFNTTTGIASGCLKWIKVKYSLLYHLWGYKHVVQGKYWRKWNNNRLIDKSPCECFSQSIWSALLWSKTLRWQGVPFPKLTAKSTEADTITWSKLPWEEKASTEHSPGSEVRNKSRKVGLWVPESGMQVGKSTLWMKLRVIEILKEYLPG